MNTPLIETKFVVHSAKTESFWVHEEGFVAEKQENASQLTYTEANRLALQFWRAGASVKPVSA